MVQESIMARARPNYQQELAGDDVGDTSSTEYMYNVDQLPTPTDRSVSQEYSDSHLNPYSDYSNIDAPSVCPLNLFIPVDDRLFISQSLPTSARKPRYDTTGPQTKNMADMIGTITQKEFDDLPLAVRRKYFSTLERLRFAQRSESNVPSIQSKRRQSLAERRGLKSPLVDSSRQFTRRLRKGVQKNSSSVGGSWYSVSPEDAETSDTASDVRTDGRQSPLNNIVLFDAADLNLQKAKRQNEALTNSTAPTPRSSAPPSRGSARSRASKDYIEVPISTSFADMFDNFHWMDEEEEDLHLKLVLDDYHANLDGAVIPLPHTSHPHRPSFRRHMSISQMPLGRPSFSSFESSRKSLEVVIPPRTSSRPLSAMGSRRSERPSMNPTVIHAPMEQQATYYQDPQARLKLRVYLASPQKFDEAVEFGFPSLDSLPDLSEKENMYPQTLPRQSSNHSRAGNDTTVTFLNDDMASLSSNSDLSMYDLDSPITPSHIEGTLKSVTLLGQSPMSSPTKDFSHLGFRKPVTHRPAPSEPMLSPGTGREMTLRMTLTRSDLRADESQLYGWQEKEKPKIRSPLAELSPISLDTLQKTERLGPFGGVDGWGPLDKEDGVVKKLWNRVRSSQRRVL